MNRHGFTMVELLFVIIILGALAGTATTWLLQTRTDSQVAMLKSDISTLLKQVPAEVMASDINISTNPPSGFKTWGDWLMHISVLDPTRWKATQNGVVAISYTNDDTNTNKVLCDGNYLYIDTTKAEIHFLPKNINTKASSFCKIFAQSYNSNMEIKVHLTSSNAVKY